MHRHAKLAQDAVPQVGAPPADHAVPRQIRAKLDPADQCLLLCPRQRGLRSRGPLIAEPIQSAGVVAMHPVPQGLAIHAGCRRRRRAGGPIQHQRNRQGSAHGACILHPSCTGAELRSRQIRPRDRNRRHGQLREPKSAHIESRITPAGNSPAQESKSGAVGITPSSTRPSENSTNSVLG